MLLNPLYESSQMNDMEKRIAIAFVVLSIYASALLLALKISI